MTLKDQIEASTSGAIFSPCRSYRYLLWRRWEGGNGKWAHFCGLNPSTADETANDPTIRREIDFCRRWGLSGLLKTNAFAFRATDPRVMKAQAEPVGPENDSYILCAGMLCGVSVAAWGVHGDHMNRNVAMLKMIPWMCFGTTKDGHPKHPLYLKKDTQLTPL